MLWQGLELPLMELARVEVEGVELRGTGTQLGVKYELRYELDPTLLRLELVGERRLEVPLDGLDFFDLGNSPLFNSLPVLRDRLLEVGEARDYVMRWVSVPELEVHESPQRYEPLDERVVRFSSGDFVADVEFARTVSWSGTRSWPSGSPDAAVTDPLCRIVSAPLASSARLEVLRRKPRVVRSLSP